MALPLIYARNQIKKSPKNNDGARLYKNLRNDIFGNNHRIILPISLKSKSKVSATEKRIKLFLEENKYQLLDYVRGTATDENGKQQYRVGKLLHKLGNKRLATAFQKDKRRSSKDSQELKIIVSRHPYDIGGMSTDRHWTSCMTFSIGKGICYPKKDYTTGGENHAVATDIKNGSLIAYLINADDTNINYPLSRVLIKPYRKRGKDKQIYYKVSRIYGVQNSTFHKQLKKWVHDTLNKKEENFGRYEFKGGYSEPVDTNIVLVYNEVTPIEEFFKIKDTVFTKIGNVYNIDRSYVSTRDFPNLNNCVVNRSFSVSRLNVNKKIVNKLPVITMGTLLFSYCGFNQLEKALTTGYKLQTRRLVFDNCRTLQNDLLCKIGVFEHLEILNTPMKQLNFPQIIKGNLTIHLNDLSNLKEHQWPEIVRGNFSIHSEKMKSSYYGPKQVYGDCIYEDCTELKSISKLPKFTGKLHITSNKHFKSVKDVQEATGLPKSKIVFHKRW